MDWEGLGVADSIVSWLEGAKVAGYANERRLDPFATSMRDFDDVSLNLQAVRSGNELAVTDPRQRNTDLKNAGLVTEHELSPLGVAAIEGWEHFEVATPIKSDEFARHLILVFEAQRISDVKYNQYFEYWSDLRNSFNPVDLIDNWDALYALNYLDFERGGFIPGQCYREQKTVVDDIAFDLDEFAHKIGASKNAKLGAERLAAAISGKIPRGRHRATFCAALEVVLGDEASASNIVDKFGIPKRPRSWVPFDDNQKTVIYQIIRRYINAPAAKSGSVATPEESGHPQNVNISDEQEAVVKISLPADIDFENVLVDPPISSMGTKKQSAVVKSKAARKIDHKAKTAKNEIVGALGENFAMLYEQWRLRDHSALAAKIEHLSITDDSKGYDILSFETDGTERFVEVKSTLTNVDTPFFISAAELATAHSIGERYVLLRVFDLEAAPKCCEIRMPFDEKLKLSPTSYMASFK